MPSSNDAKVIASTMEIQSLINNKALELFRDVETQRQILILKKYH